MHCAVSSRGKQAGRSKTPLMERLPLEGAELKSSETPSGSSQDTLAAGTAPFAAHSITLCPLSLRKSTHTVGGTARKRPGVTVSKANGERLKVESATSSHPAVEPEA